MISKEGKRFSNYTIKETVGATARLKEFRELQIL